MGAIPSVFSTARKKINPIVKKCIGGFKGYKVTEGKGNKHPLIPTDSPLGRSISSRRVNHNSDSARRARESLAEKNIKIIGGVRKGTNSDIQKVRATYPVLTQSWNGKEQIEKESSTKILKVVRDENKLISEFIAHKWVQRSRAPLKKYVVGLFAVAPEDSKTKYLLLEPFSETNLRTHFNGAAQTCRYALMDTIFQIVMGAAAFEEQGFQHNDLKPENILVHHDKTFSDVIVKCKICDLGLASKSDRHEKRGNRLYMSPERLGILGDDGGIKHKSDSWAIGLMFAEMQLGGSPVMQKLFSKYKDDQLPSVQEITDVLESTRKRIHREGGLDAANFFVQLCRVHPEERIAPSKALTTSYLYQRYTGSSIEDDMKASERRVREAVQEKQANNPGVQASHDETIEFPLPSLKIPEGGIFDD